MLDSTLLGSIGAFVIKYILGAAILFSGVMLFLRIRKTTNEFEDFSEVIPDNGLHMGLWFLGLMLLMILWPTETAYRNKTNIDQNNPVLQEKLEKVDSAPAPKIQEVQEPKESAEEKQKKAEAENKKAIEEFNKLPNTNKKRK